MPCIEKKEEDQSLNPTGKIDTLQRKEKVRATAKMMKWHVTGKYWWCKAGGLRKMKQKPVPMVKKLCNRERTKIVS